MSSLNYGLPKTEIILVDCVVGGTMGHTTTILGSILTIKENQIMDQAFHVTFKDVAYVSDHYDRKKQPRCPNLEQLTLFDGTVLAFISPDRVHIENYPQHGTIKGSKNLFDYVNHYHIGNPEKFSIFFLILPKEYYPKKFIVPNEPHFAARVGERIRITWWFKDEFDIKLEIEKNSKRYLDFDFIDDPTFSEKHPNIVTAYRKLEDLASKVLGEVINT